MIVYCVPAPQAYCPTDLNVHNDGWRNVTQAFGAEHGKSSPRVNATANFFAEWEVAPVNGRIALVRRHHGRRCVSLEQICHGEQTPALLTTAIYVTLAAAAPHPTDLGAK